MAEEAATYPVTMMCAALGLNRASYYRWRVRQQAPVPPRTQRHETVTKAIVSRFAATHGRVGRRPMRALLAADGIACSLGMVHAIMQEQDLVARRRRAWKRTTVRDPAAATAHIANHCLDAAGRRDFTSTHPGTVTVGDITYLPTREGWLYLAVVIDLATRAVVGWSLRPSLHAQGAQSALAMAHQHGRLVRAAIFHSDRGSQYTSAVFQQQCTTLTVTQSMGATGVCWDNAVAEAFFATLKSDLASEVGTFATRQEARGWVVRYIEGWYNRQRPHSSVGNVPPLIAWEQQLTENAVSHS